MNYQTRAFQISFLVHSLILVLALFLSAFVGQSKKITVLDFQLQKPQAQGKKVEPPPPATEIKTKPLKPLRQTLKESPPALQEKPRAASSAETSPTVKLPEAPSLDSRPMGLAIPEHPSKTSHEGTPGIPGGTKDGTGSGAVPGTGTGSGVQDGTRESARTRYLKEHFAYIRDKILRNISYPDSARRMGWQGKVLLSFIISADGSVKEFKIIQGSGFPILDKSAIETVRDAAPFPKPPGEAQLVIPIVYRLE